MEKQVKKAEGDNMTDLDKAIIGRIEKAGHKFELFLDPEKAYAYLEGQKKDLNNILVVDEVFKDAKKGERQSPQALKEAFGTDDVYTVLKEVLEKGEVQLTTEQRRKMLEKRRRQILAIIAREAIDVRTNAPIPMQRLELALEHSKIHVDPFKPAEQQVEEVVKALKKELPLKMEHVKIAVKVPSAYTMKAYGILKSYHILKEEWTSAGDLIVMLELPAGLQGELFDKLGKATHGEVQTKILGEQGK